MSAPGLEELRRRFPRVAVAHDWLTAPGGSEQVVAELLELFPDAELFTTIYTPAPWSAWIGERRVHTSALDRIPGAGTHYQQLLPLMTRAWRAFDFSGFDLVLSSSHACAKNLLVPPGTLHVCYCHTPMRYAWDPAFLDGEEVGRLRRLLLPPLLARLRREDVAGAAGPDAIVANSTFVAERIARRWGREATVVHPPVDVDRFLAIERDPGDAYLVFGRVVPYKRVDLAVAACRLLDRPLDIAGSGRALASVRPLGGPRTRFLGRVPDADVPGLFGHARALLFPGEEDFGIVPVEAQAAGLPVIAYGVGGVRDSVTDGETGVLFDAQTPTSLAAAIERAEQLPLDPEAARANARRFGRESFQAEMAEVIARAADVGAVTPPRPGRAVPGSSSRRS